MRIPPLTYGPILAAICLPLDAYAATQERFIPDCAGNVTIAHARIARVERSGDISFIKK